MTPSFLPETCDCNRVFDFLVELLRSFLFTRAAFVEVPITKNTTIKDTQRLLLESIQW